MKLFSDKAKSKLSDLASSAGEQLKKSVDDVKSGNIKIPDIKEASSKIENLKNIDLAEAKNQASDKAMNLLNKVRGNDNQNEQDTEDILTSAERALQVMYYLIAADGIIADEEEEKLEAIAKEWNIPEFSMDSMIIEECKKQLEKAVDPEDWDMIIRDGVDRASAKLKQASDGAVSPKLLLWDSLTIAYCDGNYDASERQLLKYIVLKLDVDKSIFLEMESTIATLMDLEREMTWLKQTDRPYLQIENMVNELVDRRNVIMDSVKDLILL